MTSGQHEVMFRVEDRLWWYVGMQAITRAVVERTYVRGGDLRILDAGCGTGASMAYLSDYGRTVGFDFSTDALALCRRRGLRLVAQGSIGEIPCLNASFDLVTSFDVISDCGVPNDVRALRECARVLRPGGRVVLRVPAYNWLRGQHDRVVGTCHRYTLGEMCSKLLEAGLQPEWWSYANACLLPFAVLKRFAERIVRPAEGRSDIAIDYGAANSVFRWVLGAEAPLVARMGLPFGLTVVVVGRRRAE